MISHTHIKTMSTNETTCIKLSIDDSNDDKKGDHIKTKDDASASETKCIKLSIEDYFNSNDEENEGDYNILEVTTSQTAAFKQLFKRLKNLTTNLNMSFVAPNPKGGLMISNITDDRSAYVKVKLDACQFEYFDCEESVINVGVDMAKFYSILVELDDSEQITFYINNKSKYIMHIKGTGYHMGYGKHTLVKEIRLLDLSRKIINLNSIEFQNMITIESEKLHNICQLYTSCDFIKIITHGKEIIFNGNSNTEKINLSYTDTRDNSNKKETIHVEGTYDIGLLRNFSKCYYLCNEIDIYHKNDFPIVLRIRVTTLGNMYIFISPIIHADNEYANNK